MSPDVVEMLRKAIRNTRAKFVRDIEFRITDLQASENFWMTPGILYKGLLTTDPAENTSWVWTLNDRGSPVYLFDHLVSEISPLEELAKVAE